MVPVEPPESNESVTGRAPELPGITVIDDDPTNLKLVALTLGDLYRVTAYSDPHAALDGFRSGVLPDLIICDVVMPGMTGFELHEQVRRIPALRSVPFLFLTAMSGRNHQRRAMVQGADDYITKPFSLDDLREAVRVRLERADDLRADASAKLAISSLGGAGLTAAGRRLQWEARRVVVLILYLLSQGGVAPLRSVRQALWEPGVHENSVRVLLNRARRTLGEAGALSVDAEVVRLDTPLAVSWDAPVFERAAREALDADDPVRVEVATRLYHGEFLPGFDAPWADEQRAYYEELYRELLEAAVRLADGEAELAAAESRLEAYYGA